MAVEIYYEGGNREAIEKWLGNSCSFHEQSCGDLGVKIKGIDWGAGMRVNQNEVPTKKGDSTEPPSEELY